MKTWNFVDKSKWSLRGPWDAEPDKAYWVDSETGFDCLIHRGPHGGLCGYVGLPKDHAFYGLDYDHELIDVDVHGGLTFASSCTATREDGSGICHPKDGGANDDVWWLGFDCAHCDDVSPSYERHYSAYSTYKTMDYVKHHVTSLARQLSSPNQAES